MKNEGKTRIDFRWPVSQVLQGSQSPNDVFKNLEACFRAFREIRGL